MSLYKNPICRGSIVLGSACGHCERCQEERAGLVAADVSLTAQTPAGKGLSYETASRLGLALVQKAAETHNWHGVLDELFELREVMRREYRRMKQSLDGPPRPSSPPDHTPVA